jgi:outer membrane protein TolC
MFPTLVLIGFVVLGMSPDAKALTLNEYLKQVQSQNPQARAAREAMTSTELRLKQADAQFSPELFADYGLRNDERETAQPSFMGTRTSGMDWRLGVQQQTHFGLGGKVFFQRSHTEVEESALPLPNYVDSAVGVELSQSLWRNGFGSQTRAEYKVQIAESRIAYFREKFNFKNIILSAQNTYWSLSSLNEIVKLQEENVVRATRLRDRMRGQARVRLFDEVEALQAEAALQSRELELMSSKDERAALMRQFNTLRGVASDEVEALDQLPSNELRLDEKMRGLRLTREDLQIMKEESLKGIAESEAAASRVLPQLDLVATYTTNGKDAKSSVSYDELNDFDHPAWTVGVHFSVPLDVSMLFDLRRAAKAGRAAADRLREYSDFNAQRVWDDLVKQHEELRLRYEKSQSVEKIQTDLVRKQQTRLRQGRSTTFETINFEQSLALTQIQRVRSQLALVQVHNAVKTFEELK